MIIILPTVDRRQYFIHSRQTWTCTHNLARFYLFPTEFWSIHVAYRRLSYYFWGCAVVCLRINIFLYTHTSHRLQRALVYARESSDRSLPSVPPQWASLTLRWKDTGGRNRCMRRKRREQGGSEGVSVQVWDSARWIAQPSRQFITVIESGRESRGEKREGGWGIKKREERMEHSGGDRRSRLNRNEREAHWIINFMYNQIHS